MPASVAINGQNTETINCYVSQFPQFHGGARRAVSVIPILGRSGGLLGSPVTTAPGEFDLVGSINRTTVAEMWSSKHAFKALCQAGLVTVTVDDGTNTAVETTAICRDVEIVPRLGKQHFQSMTVADFKASFVSPDATWKAVQPTVLSLATSTRRNIELGEAPSPYILRIMGSATNPTVEYRDASGAVVWSLAFTVTLASTDYLELDSRTGLITKYASGVASDGIALLNSGSQAAWPSPIDPHDGDTTTSQWPTIGPSAGTGELLYWKAWL